MNLQTTYLGLGLAHPLIAGASPLSATLDGIRQLEAAGAAAIVTATLYEDEVIAEEEALESAGVVGAESHPEVRSYRPPLGRCRGPRASHVEMVARAAHSISVPLIASLNATTPEGWIGLAADLQSAGAAAIELNFHRVPIRSDQTSADVEGQLIATVREVSKAVNIPVAVKLDRYFTAPAHLVSSLADAGAKGIVLFNRLYEPDIDLTTRQYHLTLDWSTRDDLRVPLRWIALLAGTTPLSLAASGGVEGVDEVAKYLLAGADAVQTASALLRHGPRYLERLVKDLAAWVGAQGAASVSEIRGRMSAARLTHPDVLERSHHTPALLRECPCKAPDAPRREPAREPVYGHRAVP